ncbi:hypothetical protein K1X76_09370 [bacterium]|nr:hypothetical protein [bacterium]
MNKLKIVVLVLFFILPSVAFSQEDAQVEKKVLILGSFADYNEALKAAKNISKKSDVLYATRGLVYDAKKGLYWPASDTMVSGEYLARRYNEDCDNQSTICLTIEKSEYYNGFKPKFYIIVGGIYDKTDPEAKIQLNFFKKYIPDAYLKETSIYMGCMH